jgi:protein-S-isoprenylcysteine O-methyltransferase Ste14
MIEEGLHRLSRNPLYVGLLALYLGLALLAPTFWGLVLFPAALLLVLWGALPGGAVAAQAVRCPVRRLHAARASLAVNTTDLQQELPEAHLPLVERCGPYCDGLF